MKEDFVTLETAKLLKEKGFDETCEYCILNQDDDVIGASRGCIINEKIVRHKNIKNAIPITSLYQAQKWLRDTKCLHIEVGYMYGDYWLYDILTIPTHDLIGLEDRASVRYNTYEGALEAGIQEALKLVEE